MCPILIGVGSWSAVSSPRSSLFSPTLIAEKYTSPEHLGIAGGSAGGILVSNAITEQPKLFGAAISAVGVNNALLAETTSNGVPNIPEFGTFKTEESFKSLLAMDGYYKVKDGVKYQAVMLTHGINDPRVEPWMSAKMAARLQAATASGNCKRQTRFASH